MDIEQWKHRWGIPEQAVNELRQMLILEASPETMSIKTPEQAVQTSIRIEAAEKGMVLWRNNVGQATTENGGKINFGLANDSAKMNKRIKSSDLIGIRPVTITQGMVGHTIGQFVAREVKAGSWSYSGTDREKAQAKFLELVLTSGGDAGFANGIGTL